MKFLMLFLALLLHHSIAYPSVQSDNNSKITEKDNESSKKIIGSSVVTSVSVILNGKEPQFTDAVGHRIPKPQVPLQVASPINLLNPDRYEFYTFDNDGQLVKRIMTLQEIHSIVANGDGDGGATVIHNSPIDERDPNKNVQDIVASVQNVLTKEVEWKKNISNPDNQQNQMLDTPDVSSSWSMILPAIFGNTGGDIFTSNNRPQQVVMIPDSDVVEHSTKPNKRKQPKPSSIKRKPITTTTVLPQKIPDDIITTTSTTPEIQSPISQIIFVNNKEMIKPLFNRNDIKIDSETKIDISTTLKPITTTKTKIITTTKHTEKTKPTETTKIEIDLMPEMTTKRIMQKPKPITTIMPMTESTMINKDLTNDKLTANKNVYNKNRLTTPLTTTPTVPTTTTSLPSTTKKIQKQSTTTTAAATLNLDEINPITEKVQLIKYTKKPTTTQTSTKPPTTIKIIKRKETTTTTKKPSTSTISPFTTERNEKITTELPLDKINDQIATTSVTESLNKFSDAISSSTETITEIDIMKDKDTTTASLNTIVNSLLKENDEDMNTKLSFDQIMESLKDKDNNKPTENNFQKNIPTKLPILYNNNNEKLIPIQKQPLKSTEEQLLTIDMTTTTLMPENYEKIDMTTYSSSNLESINIDNANIVKYDQLYAELLDPILNQLTTTENILTTDLPSENIMTTTLMPSILSHETNNNDDNLIINKPNEFSDNATKIEILLKKPNNDNISNSHSSELTQKVNEFIANNMQNTEEKIYIKLQNPNIKDYLNQESEMNMLDLQKEIATVASMLNRNNIQITTINPNKLDNNQDDDEIQALLSDVYNQITNAPLIQTSIISSPENLLNENSNDKNNDDNIESSNRFTNLAKLNTSILIPPKDITQNFNINDKFHLLETLALKLNETKNDDDDDILPIDNLNKINNTINMTDTTNNNNNNIVIAQKNNLTNSNSMNLNKNTNAIELNSLTTSTTTTETILPIENNDSTEKIVIENNNMEIEDENVSSTEFTSNDEIDDNIFDSTTTTIKIIESLIKTTVQPLIKENIIKKITTTEKNTENLTKIPANSEIESINDDISTIDMHKNNENENIFNKNNEMTTIEIDTEKNNNKIDEITEKFIENFLPEKFIEKNNMINENLLTEKLDTTTILNEKLESNTEQSTEVEMELVKLILKPTTTSSTTEKPKLIVTPTQTTDIFNITETEQIYIKLGESTKPPQNFSTPTPTTTTTTTNIVPTTDEDVTIRLTIIPQTPSPIKRKPTLKPVHYFKQPISQTDQKLMIFNGNQQRPVIRPAALTNLKISQISSATRSPVKLEPSPEQSLGLEASTLDLQEDIQEFARLCNELAFNYWRSITAEKISNARSLVLSPFALTSMLSMVFLGARGSTSGEMNEILRLDDMVTFNPHLVFKNITESVEHAKDSDIASSAFVREIFSDRANGKILPFFKEKTQQIYSGHVEEVNFNVVNDIIRRRTNLLIKRHTGGKVMEYLRTNSVWVNGPLSTVTANLFQTDCSRGSINDRDGEMFFQVHPSVRQRRLVPIPAVVWRSGFTAGYDPELDATVVAFGSTDETISTIYVMPGQHGLAAPGDNLERLERNIMENGISKNVWSHLLTSLMQRPGLEIQLPRFSHRSFVNATIGLQKLGLKALFNSDNADLGGLTGSSKKDIYLSDMIQINTFSTCGEEKIGDHHHVEMYPAPPLRKRNSDIGENDSDFMDIEQIDFGSIVHNTAARGFYDDLLDPKYLELPLPLRPRQARIPDAPRLRFDKPFLYFVRHNPTGMILFMGRFNPRLLP